MNVNAEMNKNNAKMTVRLEYFNNAEYCASERTEAQRVVSVTSLEGRARPWPGE